MIIEDKKFNFDFNKMVQLKVLRTVLSKTEVVRRAVPCTRKDNKII